MKTLFQGRTLDKQYVQNLFIKQKRISAVELTIEEIQKKIVIKLKLLQYVTKNIKQTFHRGGEREIKRSQKLIDDTLDEIQTAKCASIENKIGNNTELENLDNWTQDIDNKAAEFEKILKDIETKLEHTKSESKKDEVRKVTDEQSTKLQAATTRARLPKLQISTFKGTQFDWLRFWNQFTAEIESSDVSPVIKFSYLKEMLLPQAISLVGGLPFNEEGFESEVGNAHIQCIMNLQTIHG